MSRKEDMVNQYITTGITYLNTIERRLAAVLLRKCCSSSAWVEEMVVNRPYVNFDAVKQAAYNCTRELSTSDWKEGFSGLSDISNNNQTIQHLEDAYFYKFGVPFLLDGDSGVDLDWDASTIIASLESALAIGTVKEEQSDTRRKFMKGLILNLATLLASLGDKNKPVRFHQARIESSVLQVDTVQKLKLHPARAAFWNGQRLKGLLEWEYEEKDVELWGGLNYRRTLPEKPNHVNHFEGKTVERATSSVQPPVSQPQRRQQRFFGGRWT